MPMLLSLLCLTGAQDVQPDDTAPEPIEDTATVVHEQVVEVQERIADQSAKLDAIEHYLVDEQLVKAGRAPRGWEQPPITAYSTPGAPPSFVPTVAQ